MGLFDRFRNRAPQQQPAREPMAPNPWRNPKVRSAGFFSTDVGRLLQGWETTSSAIDHYLRAEHTELVARSRRLVRNNPYGKRFLFIQKNNIVGPNGITIQAQSTRFVPRKGELFDTPANDAIEAAFRDWCKSHADYYGNSSFVELQSLAIASAGQDGEYIFRKEYTGKYGFQLRAVDAQLLETRKNGPTNDGGEIRLGVEYDKVGKVVAYWFRDPDRTGYGSYSSGQIVRVLAKHIIHGFLPEWPDQSRGIPWMHAGLERAKHLEKYEEAAIVKARSTAATMAVLKTREGYEGDDGQAEDGVSLDQYEPGTIKDIGDNDIVQLDSDYPHQMYAAFVKSNLQGIASAWGISYHSLSNDLEGVNYSSIRAGVLEDREHFKGLQNWFIRGFVRPVYEEWLSWAWMKGLITVGNRPLSRPLEEYMPAHYQARRWAWVDPAKDGAANQAAMTNRLKSRSQIMREQGDDPETVWREIAREEQLMQTLGLQQVPAATPTPKKEDDDDD